MSGQLTKFAILMVFYVLSLPSLAEEPADAKQEKETAEQPMPGSLPSEPQEKYIPTWYHGAFNKEGKPFPDQYAISIGSFSVRGIEVEARVTPKGVPLGAILNLNDDLGAATSDDSYRIDGYWRFTPVHRLEASYYKVRIEGNRTLRQDFEWDGVEYKAGANIDSFFEQDTFKINYLYSFFHTKKVEVGLGAGLHLTDLGIGLSVTNPDDVDIGPSLNEAGSISATLPLPVFSLIFDYKFTPKFGMRARNDWFAISYEGTTGRFSDLLLTFEYQVIRNLALGIGWDRVTMDVAGDTEDANWSANINYDGWNLFVKGVF